MQACNHANDQPEDISLIKLHTGEQFIVASTL